LKMRKSAINIQRLVRRVVYRSVFLARMSLLFDDRVFRRRCSAATLIARCYCEHVVYDIYMANMRERIAEAREVQRLHREKQRTAAELRKNFIIYR